MALDGELRRGVHIFHATTLSNCSQRVIFTACEKGIDWRAHPIDLKKGQQVSPAYLSVNPKGLVPALVHDGRVVVESNRIIEYLDEAFPAPPLRPSDALQREEMQALLAQSDAVQAHIKTLTFEFLLNPMAKMSPAALAQYEKRQTDTGLVAFHRTFSTVGFSDEALRAATDKLTQPLAALEERLTSQRFLCGDALSLADISWVVNVHRMDLLGVPLKRTALVSGWYRQIARRASYKRSVDALEPFGMRAMFALNVARRRLGGTDIRAHLPAAA